MEKDDYITSLEGPVELVDDKLTLRIPLAAGGTELIECSRGIAHVTGEELHIIVPQWLATKLGILEGSRVVVDNRDGKFNIRTADGPTN